MKEGKGRGRVPPLMAKISPNSGKRGKNWEKEEKLERKGKDWEGSFPLTPLTGRAGYATNQSRVSLQLSNCNLSCVLYLILQGMKS